MNGGGGMYRNIGTNGETTNCDETSANRKAMFEKAN
jgi:hypothetical protein